MTNYRDFAIQLAKEAGTIMRDNFSLGMAKEWKADNTPLTVTDTTINRMVVEAVAKEYPDHSLLGEEESSQVVDTEYVWVCDPVDGTIPFSYGLPLSTFSLALTKNGESILGVIYDPFLDRLYVGEKGKGTTLNEKPIQVSEQTEIGHSLMNVEWSTNADYDLSRVSPLLKARRVKAICLNSYAITGALVASGDCLGAIIAHNHPWDAAAVKIIVDEAGGKVTDLFGNDQRYDKPMQGCVASNGKIHHELLDIIQESMRLSDIKDKD